MQGHYWSHIECRWVPCPAPDREPAGRGAVVPEQALPEQSVRRQAVPEQALPGTSPTPVERTAGA